MTTIAENITQLVELTAALAKATRVPHHEVVKIIEIALSKQTADQQLQIQQLSLGMQPIQTPTGELTVLPGSIVPNEIITGSVEQPPEEEA